MFCSAVSHKSELGEVNEGRGFETHLRQQRMTHTRHPFTIITYGYG